MKKDYPVIKDGDTRFSFLTEAKILYRFRIEAARRGMSTGKLIGLLIKSYVQSLDNE